MQPDPDRQSLELQREDLRESLRLIAERKATFASPTTIPLQLLSDEKKLQRQLDAVEQQITVLEQTPVRKANWNVTASQASDTSYLLPIVISVILIVILILVWLGTSDPIWRFIGIFFTLIAFIAFWISKPWQRKSDNVQRRYYEWWQSEHTQLNTYGLSGITQSLKVRDIFVDLKIERGQANNALVSDRLLRAESVWDFLRSSMEAVNSKHNDRNHVWVLLGGAGFGKTTLMQHVATELIYKNHHRYKIPPCIPILLYLREYNDDLCRKEPPSLGRLLYTIFTQTPVKPHESWFEDQLEQGKCVVLLDGLDEIAKKEQRQQVARWIDAQIKTYYKTVFVLTSRPTPYAEAELMHPRVCKLRMQSFTREQQREFLQKWYAQDIQIYKTKNTREREHQVHARTARTMDELQQNPNLRELAGNPLVLSMIATLTQDQGKLPNTRSALYKEFCDVLVKRRAERKGLHDDFLNAQTKNDILKELAFAMMQAGDREFPDHTAQQAVAHLIADLKNIPTDREFSVLKNIQDTTNLVLEISGKKWMFAHLSFQEYLATFKLHEQRSSFDWANAVTNKWWADTLRFYAEIYDATPIVKAALETGAVHALALADMCSRISERLAPAVQEQLNQRVEHAFESNDVAQRCAATEVLLAQRLSPLHSWSPLPTSDTPDAEIDTKFITCAEYQLFLDEEHSKGNTYQPDHWDWDNLCFPPKAARNPVGGVLFADAQGFVEWLNTRETGAWRYRLPTKREAKTETTPTAYWCTSQNGVGTLGILIGAGEDIETILASITSRIPRPQSIYDPNSANHLYSVSIRWRELAMHLTLARDLTLIHKRAHNLANHLDSTIRNCYDFTNYRDRSEPAARDLANRIQQEFQEAKSISRKLRREIVSARDRRNAQGYVDFLSSSCENAETLAANLDLASNCESFESFATHLETNSNDARSLGLALSNHLNPVSNRAKILIREIASPRDLRDLAYAQEQFMKLEQVVGQFTQQEATLADVRLAIIKLLEQFYIKLHEDSGGGYQQLLSEIALTYWWMEIVRLRAAGELLAWEGIRLVREPR